MRYLFLISIITLFFSCQGNSQTSSTNTSTMNNDSTNKAINKTEEEWKKVLSPEQYYVIRQKGTEAPFSGKFYKHTDKGTYVCAACGEELFKSDTKFDAGCGWPSFFEAIDSTKITYTRDTSHGMIRTEITCTKCGGHLGHVFDDGPQPTGLRYCVNSLSIDFKK
ncbi:MAG: peptide-methionine (R)-S-oxide reductase MsrB [Bacteroidetes bacterium]|nr:peptide-methionine (R)-S-oxide reductase MsrB [Bacteroidota bacterium]